MAYVPPAQHSPRNPFSLDDAPPSVQTPILDLSPQQLSAPCIKEFTYDLLNKSGKAWAVLSLLGDTEYSRTVPAFVEGANVAGEVRLELESGDPIQSVVISVRLP